MRTVLENILLFHPQNTSDLVLIVGGLIWLGLWLLAIADIRASARGGAVKFFLGAIVSVPLAGVLLYAFWELIVADWRAAFSWRKSDSKAERKIKARYSSQSLANQ